jgi:hypothetical protein
MAAQKLGLTRDQLAKFLTDHEQIKQFEKLFLTVDTIGTVTLDDITILASGANASANEALAQITRIADALELLAQAPQNELGTIAPQNADNVNITGGLISGLDAPIPVPSGGTGANSLTAGYLIKGNGTSAVAASVVYDDGANVAIGTTNPLSKFQVKPELASGSSFFVDNYDTGSGGSNVNVWVRTENYNNDGYGDGFYSLYARGTAASPTAVQSGDVLGSLASAGYDGTDFRYRAAIRFSVDGAVSAGVVPTAMTFRTGTSSQIERMRIKSTGQVRFVPLASAPSGAQAGDVYYDSGTNKLRCYDGTIWNDLF